MSDATSASGDSTSDADLLDEFLLDAEVQGLMEKTLVTYRSDLEYFIEWLDGNLLDVDRHDLKGFLAHLKNERTARDGTTDLAPSTLNTYFSALNSCFKFLEWEGYIEENPVPAFRDRYNNALPPLIEKHPVGEAHLVEMAVTCSSKVNRFTVFYRGYGTVCETNSTYCKSRFFKFKNGDNPKAIGNC